MKFKLFIVTLSLLSAQCFAACDTAKYNQFDFWVGEWDVFTAKGTLAGKNSITKQLNNCILKEHYTTPSGYEGQSINIYDAVLGQWNQTWVDNSGLLLSLKGIFDGTSMVLSGKGVDKTGASLIHRITWTPAPDKSVRQHWESSTDKGQTWLTLFDGKYVKREK